MANNCERSVSKSDRCLLCGSDNNIELRSFDWEYRPRSKYNKPIEYTELDVILCEPCYVYNEGAYLIGRDWWDAVDGLIDSTKKCLLCRTDEDVMKSVFEWECTKKDKPIEYTKLEVVLCELCYRYNDEYYLIGSDWREAVYGLIEPPTASY